MNRKEIEEDFAYCENIIRDNSKSFYRAFSSLPKERAQAVYAVYNFCRTVDDAVDLIKDPLESQKMLAEIEARLEKIYREEGAAAAAVPEAPVEPVAPEARAVSAPAAPVVPEAPAAPAVSAEKGWLAFAYSVKKWNIDKQPFLDQIQGQRMDLVFKQFGTLQELLLYCDLVAGSVGRMLLPILAVENAGRLITVASELGVAMQITNILRDVGEDLKERNRIYIPGNFMAEYNVTKDELLNAGITDNFIKLWERMSRESEKRYSEYKNHILDFDRECRFSLYASVNLYSAINEEVRKAGYNCLSKRNHVSKSNALRIVKETRESLKNLEANE